MSLLVATARRDTTFLPPGGDLLPTIRPAIGTTSGGEGAGTVLPGGPRACGSARERPCSQGSRSLPIGGEASWRRKGSRPRRNGSSMLARESGLTPRLLGAVAFARRAERMPTCEETARTPYTDIDFAAYGRRRRRRSARCSRGRATSTTPTLRRSEGSRLVAEHPRTGMHLDVFLDKLEFCHTVPWKDRLEIDPETIPLAELLLQKMQIVEINEKDLIDTIMLLLEFPLGDDDDETINIGWSPRLRQGLGLVADAHHEPGQGRGRWRRTTSSSPTTRQACHGAGPGRPRSDRGRAEVDAAGS